MPRAATKKKQAPPPKAAAKAKTTKAATSTKPAKTQAPVGAARATRATAAATSKPGKTQATAGAARATRSTTTASTAPTKAASKPGNTKRKSSTQSNAAAAPTNTHGLAPRLDRLGPDASELITSFLSTVVDRPKLTLCEVSASMLQAFRGTVKALDISFYEIDRVWSSEPLTQKKDVYHVFERYPRLSSLKLEEKRKGAETLHELATYLTARGGGAIFAELQTLEVDVESKQRHVEGVDAFEAALGMAMRVGALPRLEKLKFVVQTKYNTLGPRKPPESPVLAALATGACPTLRRIDIWMMDRADGLAAAVLRMLKARARRGDCAGLAEVPPILRPSIYYEEKRMEEACEEEVPDEVMARVLSLYLPTSLEELVVDGRNTEFVFECFMQLNGVAPALREIHVAGSAVTDVIRLLKCGVAPNLTHLYIQKPDEDDMDDICEDMGKDQFPRVLSRLVCLDVEGVCLKDVHLYKMTTAMASAAARQMPRLETLRLIFSCPEDYPYHALRPFFDGVRTGGFRSLRELELFQEDVEEEEEPDGDRIVLGLAKALCDPRAKASRSLRTLSLGGMKHTDDSLDSLACLFAHDRLPHLKNLTLMFIDTMRHVLTEDGLRKLAKALEVGRVGQSLRKLSTMHLYPMVGGRFERMIESGLEIAPAEWQAGLHALGRVLGRGGLPRLYEWLGGECCAPEMHWAISDALEEQKRFVYPFTAENEEDLDW